MRRQFQQCPCACSGPSGDRVFICANQHLNPTNVCILRATCTFCSFARTPREDGAYTMTLDEAFHEAAMATDTPVREFHIVGGLHPKLRLSYYEDLIRGLKERHPGVDIKRSPAALPWCSSRPPRAGEWKRYAIQVGEASTIS
jgi:2-iminoacetate synthase ThiH